MATYYVRNDGNNSNLGTGSASNQAWQTIAKAVGTTGISSGDTLYVAPGVYREVTSLTLTNPTAETKIIGDYASAQFSDITPGPIIMTAFLTNEKTSPSNATVLNINGRNFITIEGINFIGGSGNPNCVAANLSRNLTIRRCYFCGIGFAGTRDSFAMTNAPSTAMNLLIEECIFAFQSGAAIHLSLADASDANDYDVSVVIRNTLCWGGIQFGTVDGGGTGSGKPGGGQVHNCTLLGGGVRTVGFSGNGHSSSIPCEVYNNVLLSIGTACVSATATGHLVEDYNILVAISPRSNVTGGANSQGGSYTPLIHFGQETFFGGQSKMIGTPWAAHTVESAILGFGSHGDVSLTTDIMDRQRPAGGKSTNKSIGAFERHDTGVQETTTYDTASNSLCIVGPGDHDFLVPVEASATTFNVRARYDTDHSATNKPQMILLASPELGINAQTITMTAAVDTWETLSTTSFTPTETGVARIRFVSRSSAGTGKAFFDTFSVT